MENKLEHLNEFKNLLAHYRVSESSKKILDKTNLVLLLAPSAGGRNTVIQELLKTQDYYFVVSDTTRHPRLNNDVMEQNGEQYWFRPELEMLRDIQDGKFLEAELIHGQQVSGISIREVKKALDDNKVAITDVDVGGMNSILDVKPDTVAIIVLPPSFEEWQRRMTTRGALEQGEYKRRMQTACTIFSEALSHSLFRFVINDSVKTATYRIHQLTKEGIVDPEMQYQGRELTKQLLRDTQTWLQS